MRKTLEIKNQFEATGRDLITAALEEGVPPWTMIMEVQGRLWEAWTRILNEQEIPKRKAS